MINIGLIPLDSRPCNYVWLKRLANITNVNLITLDESMLGSLNKGSNTKSITTFLKNNFTLVDTWILSVDSMFFGGLIQARMGLTNDTDNAELIETLRTLKKNNPEITVYAFDTIMRTSITSLSKEEAIYWSKVNEYSKYYGLSHFFNKEEDKNRLNELIKEIPSSIIDTFHKARNKKHEINKMIISLVKDHVIDEEILLQEDSMPYGIQAIEQVKLDTLIKENNLANVIHMFNGTDEGALIFFAKRLLKDSTNTLVHLLPSTNSFMDRVHLFEDHKFNYNLYNMAEVIGIKFTSDESLTNTTFAIYGEDDNIDLDLSKYTKEPVNNDIFLPFTKKINNYLNSRNVVLACLFRPNGGMIELLENIDYLKLAGYSGWNTSSNTIGLSFAQLAIVLTVGNTRSNMKFTYERCLDDALYQFYARRMANSDLEKKDINYYSLCEYEGVAIDTIKKYMKDYLKEINNLDYSFNLPWGRTFECDIEIDKDSFESTFKKV